MKIIKPTIEKKILFPVSIAAFMTFSTLNCKRTTVVENPFTNSVTLDCRNLFIRSVSIKDSSVEVTIQNTCTTCQAPNLAYIPLFIIDRKTGDTLNSWCLCFNAPHNGETRKYLAGKIKSSKLPDLKTLEFDLGTLCKDLTYLPN